MYKTVQDLFCQKQGKKFHNLESVLTGSRKFDRNMKVHWNNKRCLPKTQHNIKIQEKFHYKERKQCYIVVNTGQFPHR